MAVCIIIHPLVTYVGTCIGKKQADWYCAHCDKAFGYRFLHFYAKHKGSKTYYIHYVAHDIYQ